MEETPGHRKEELDEFETVAAIHPDVDWDDDVEWELDEEDWEAFLEDLFTHLEGEEGQGLFEEVQDTVGWSEGEVIWEGMDFDQMFVDHGDFHAFELLSRKDKRAFLRERLRTQQASGAAEAGESALDIEIEPPKPLKGRAKKGTPPKRPKDSGPLVSYETETEHMPEELDLHITDVRGKGKRRLH